MLVHRVSKIISKNHLLQPGYTVITGTSGGADSTALLHILTSCKLDLRLIAVYIDHGLRPEETAAEQAFVKQLAAKLQVEYLSRKIAVREFQQNHRCSLEEAARTLRYQALEHIRARYDAQAIAVAHTADDQVEEFLIRMVRGSGLKGLCGMAFRRGNVVRPLLAESKDTILNYLAAQKLSFCYDSSNDDRSLLRNRIRLELLPDLEQHYNPSIRTNILQTTAILRQEEDLLEALSETLFNNLCTITPGAHVDSIPASIEFSRTAFITEHPAMQRRVLEKVCWKMQNRPTFRNLLQLQRVICDGTTGSKQHLSHGLRVRIDAEKVYFSYPAGRQHVRGDGGKPFTIEQEIPDSGVYTFPEIDRQLTITPVSHMSIDTSSPETLFVDGGKISFPLTVRSAEPGEKMRPLGAPGRKKVARILNDLKIPADLRPRHPLLVADGEVIALLGVKIADSFRVTTESTVILALRWETVTTSP